MKTLNIHTDGACSPNPGKGGWAVVAEFTSILGNETKIIIGSEEDTTNNRMELIPVIRAIKQWGKHYNICIFTDSNYVFLNYYNWKKIWKFKIKEEQLKNKDLWKQLFEIIDKHPNIKIEKVKGHSDNKSNNLADSLAVMARKVL